MKCVIFQPSYIPWRGFFDQVALADVFVFFDDVQYDKHGWRNRIKSHQGPVWLTIPVSNKGAVSQHIHINQVEINNKQPWNRKHLRTLQQAYSKAPYFNRYADLLEDFYNDPPQMLADFNIGFSIALARELGIHNTRFIRSSELSVEGQKTDRLIAILDLLFMTGPEAMSYIQPEPNKIKTTWQTD